MNQIAEEPPGCKRIVYLLKAVLLALILIKQSISETE